MCVCSHGFADHTTWNGVVAGCDHCGCGEFLADEIEPTTEFYGHPYGCGCLKCQVARSI